MPFTLNGHSFADLGIGGATLTQTAGGDDVLTLTVNQRLGSAPIFAPFQQVTLSGDGASFTGWVSGAPRRASGNSQSWLYNIVGPQQWLTRSIYQAPVVSLAKNEAGALVAVDNGEAGLTMLGRKVVAPEEEDGDVTQAHQTIKEILEGILDYAVEDQGHFTFTLPETGLAAEVPWEPRQDDNALNALRQILKWSPDTITRWAGTVLQIFASPTEATKTLSTADLACRDELNLNPRYDLLCLETRIIYMKPVQDANGMVQYEREVDAATGGEGEALGATQRAILTIYLEEGEDFPAPGIAAEFHRWAGRLHFSGQVPINGLNWNNKPGDGWTPGAQFAFDTDAVLICQAVTRDLFLRTEVLTLGVPEHLGLADMVALKRKPRRPDAGKEPAPSEEEALGTLAVILSGLPEELHTLAKWTAGELVGTGEEDVELPPGEYAVNFLAVHDLPGNAIYFANAIDATIVENATETITALYRKLNLSDAEPFEIVDVSVLVDEALSPRIRVMPSNAFMQSAIEIEELIVGGLGYVWVAIPFTVATGAIGTATIHSGSEIPDASPTSYIVPIGEYNFADVLTFFNYRYGPINGYPCRDFYADPAAHTLTIL